MTPGGFDNTHGEFATVAIDLPSDLREMFGHRRLGWHLDATMPVYRPRLRSLPGAAVGGGASFRPASGTVLKLNYRRQRSRDLVNNAPATLDGALPPDAERKILLGDLRRAVVE